MARKKKEQVVEQDISIVQENAEQTLCEECCNKEKESQTQIDWNFELRWWTMVIVVGIVLGTVISQIV